MKLHVVFNRYGDKVGDLDSMDYALSVLDKVENSDYELIVNVANYLVILCFRILVKEGKIKPYNELFLYDKDTDPNLNKPIIIDKKGEQSYYTENMCKYSDYYLRLL